MAAPVIPTLRQAQLSTTATDKPRFSMQLNLDFGEATADGRMSLESVYCLGLCSVAPSAMLDGRIIGRLDDPKLDSLLTEIER